MFDPTKLSDTVRRRTVLGVAICGATGLLAAAPQANADATLDATVDIQQYTMGKYRDVFTLSFELTNHDTVPVEPVATLWGVGRQTQHPWLFLDGPESLPPGETAAYRVRAPGDHEAVRVHPDKPAQLTLYDKGTEARAVKHFTPTDYPVGEVADAQ